MDKRVIYGVSALLLVMAYCTLTGERLKEVRESDLKNASFDTNELPENLRPPKRLESPVPLNKSVAKSFF